MFFNLHIQISDADNSRYEVPFPEVPVAGEAAPETDYEFGFNDDVGFWVKRRDTGEVLWALTNVYMQINHNKKSNFGKNNTILGVIFFRFNSSVGSFIFSDQYIQLSALLTTDYLYGLGQHNDRFARSFDWQLIPLFASLLYPDVSYDAIFLRID